MQFNRFLHLAKHHINRIYSQTAYLFASILNRYQIGIGMYAMYVCVIDARLHFVLPRTTLTSSIEYPKYKAIEIQHLLKCLYK